MKKHLPGTFFSPILLFFILLYGQRCIAQIQTGKSYVNISKGPTGGTFEPGDVLEIRSAIAVGNFAAFSITQVRYNDTIDNNFTYLPGSLKIMTNEGVTFRAFTDAANDDPGVYDASTNTIRINLGSTATAASTSTGNAGATGGTVAYNDKPSFYGGVCIMVASFRVKINTILPYNTLITLPGGAFRYNNGATALTAPFTAYKIMLFKNLGSCNNFLGANAVIDNNGTFGNGITQNRSSSAIVPGYSFTNFSANSPNDGSYGISNNSSATGATNNAVAVSDPTRVFTVWDIIGDHTAAASPTLGNPASAVGSNGGYMAVVNASYATSPAIQQTVGGLCNNTYYDFSSWFRNICPKCSCDSNGRGALNPLFKGTYAPGVKPNLTFQIDGVDYYSTGDLPYTGLWIKKGFTYLTGASQSGFTLTIRNNSPGGGGNDWAVDDVNLSICEPDVNMNITPLLLGCYGALVSFNATVSSYYPNYTFYKWQKSTDGGITWINTAVSGVGTPTLINGQWQYTGVYPSFIANQPDSGNRYRMVVASTATNLASSNCAFSNNRSTELKIIDCAHSLATQITEFSGQLIDKKSNLKWTATNENDISLYEIEKSIDGRDFEKIGSLTVRNLSISNSYQLQDIDEIKKQAYYRLKMVSPDNLFKYSNTILVSTGNFDFTLLGYTNPYRNQISIEYIAPADGKVNCNLLNANGKIVARQSFNGLKGFNKNSFDGLGNLSNGFYTLSIVYNNTVVSKKVIKVN